MVKSCIVNYTFMILGMLLLIFFIENIVMFY